MGIHIKERVKPEKVYHDVLATVDEIAKRIEINVENSQLSENQSKAGQIITEIRNNVEASLNELQNNSEWDVFTLAFYGETNAGKSTFIESLRIILSEETKVLERKKFRAIQSEYDVSSKTLENNARGEKNKKSKRIIKKELKNKLKTENEILEKSKQLEQYQDGRIVGDGRPDFTREVQKYDFTINGNKFSILDVPGIEGNEDKVKNEINNAVKKAHSIFYVTGKPTPPQSADEGKQGTLEKIKEHLGDQSEVRTVFNKRITNPIQLDKGSLISENEKEALAELDKKMLEIMGEAYAGCHVLSAQPAFLAVSECVTLESELFKKKEKFISKLSSSEILFKSGMDDFIEFIESYISVGYKNKIEMANVKKINNVILNADFKISYLLKESFIPLQKKLKVESDSTDYSLDSLLVYFMNKIDSRISNSVYKFKTKITKEVYVEIDKDIKNIEFKRLLELTIEKNINGLVKDLDLAIKEEIEDFKVKIEEILENYEKYVQGLLRSYTTSFNSIMSSDFNLKFNFNNGVNYIGIITSIVGGLAMIWNPGGWVILALGGLSIMVSIGKSIFSAFSSKYRMSQQRKIADENIANICRQINNSVDKEIEGLRPSLKLEIDNIKVLVETPVKQIKDIITGLDFASANFKMLIDKLNN